LGLWKHTGTFTKFDGGNQPGTEGIYLIFDQTFWKPTWNQNESRGLRLFLEYAQTGYKVTSINLHYGGGIVWNGPFKKHPDDAGGLSIQNAHLSPELGLPKKYELNFETFYKFKIADWLSIKPDTQYIVHPGGQYPNAFVGILVLTFKINT
jgi:porin